MNFNDNIYPLRPLRVTEKQSDCKMVVKVQARVPTRIPFYSLKVSKLRAYLTGYSTLNCACLALDLWLASPLLFSVQ